MNKLDLIQIIVLTIIVGALTFFVLTRMPDPSYSCVVSGMYSYHFENGTTTATIEMQTNQGWINLLTGKAYC